jgi:hypothetical protein
VSTVIVTFEVTFVKAGNQTMKEQPLSLTWNIISAEIIAWAKAYSGPVKPRVGIPFSGSGQ